MESEDLTTQEMVVPSENESPKDGSICGFESLHRLLESSLSPPLFQEVSRLLTGLNRGRPLGTLTLPDSSKALSSKYDFDLVQLIILSQICVVEYCGQWRKGDIFSKICTAS